MADRRVLTILFAVLTLPLPVLAGSGGILQFQHGGRATAQVGAFTARADDASAVFYNPAAICRLDGMQVLGGLDFTNATDEYNSSTGTHRASHTIQFPPVVYFTWKPANMERWGFGVGLDTPAWYRTNWDTALFPGRFLTRVSELRLFEVHPVAAYALDEKWSVGGGLRFLFGTQEFGLNTQGQLESDGDGPVFFEVSGLANADISAVSADLAIHYDDNIWGWGAVLRGPADFDENGSFSTEVRNISIPAATDTVLAMFAFDGASLSFELPLELSTGFWFAPYPELRVEVDLAYEAWSGLADTDIQLSSPTLSLLDLPQRRDWDDTFSLRLGVEGELNKTWSVSGGLAYEGSPIPDATVEPGFSRGDAFVIAFGASYNLPELSLDIGYSLHTYQDRGAAGQEPLQPNIAGEYSGSLQAWSVSARWRLGKP